MYSYFNENIFCWFLFYTQLCLSAVIEILEINGSLFNLSSAISFSCIPKYIPWGHLLNFSYKIVYVLLYDVLIFTVYYVCDVLTRNHVTLGEYQLTKIYDYVLIHQKSSLSCMLQFAIIFHWVAQFKVF